MVRATDFFARSRPLVSKSAAKAPAGSEHEILLMTDDDQVATHLEYHLRSIGYGLAWLRNQQQVLAYTDSKKPLAVICDMDTRKREGMQLLARLRSTPDTESIPFVFLCEKGQIPDKVIGRETGANDYVWKPVDPAELGARLRALIKAAPPPREAPGTPAAPPVQATQPPPPPPPPQRTRGPRPLGPLPPSGTRTPLRLTPDAATPPSTGDAKTPAVAATRAAPGQTPPAAARAEPSVVAPQPPLAAPDAAPRSVAKPPEPAPSIARDRVAGPAEPESVPTPASALAAVPTLDLERKQADELYERTNHYLTRQIELARTGNKIDLETCAQLARGVVSAMQESNALLINAIRKDEGYDIARHCTNVAVFAMKVGQGMKYDKEDLVRLTMSAILHDIGESRVPPEVLSKQGSLSRDEFDSIKKHVQYGRDIVVAADARYAWIGDIIYQHHEREEGQGYPQGLSGGQINEFAKVIGVADVYEAFSHPRTFRKAFIAYDALQKLVEMRGKFFPAKVIRALMNEISMFPVGSYVQLNTGEIGRVISTNRSQLLRPVVQTLYNADGSPKPKPAMADLSAMPLLYISKPVYDDELPEGDGRG